jgi:4-hydroxybenzoate polyprenyltransferase
MLARFTAKAHQHLRQSSERLRESLEQRFPAPSAFIAARLPGFIQLTRLDRPIGILLLLWPTLGALWIAAEGWPDWHLLFIFTLGTVVMRSAGCCINDYADSGIDGSVARTRNRPLVTGALTRRDALVCFLVLCALAFLLLLFTNRFTILLSLGAVAVTATYPFMKRYTHLPQVVLGIAFSWGILMAFSAQRGELPPVVWVLFVANCLWTVAYDTQYAMVDREYDLKIGVKSTAILFGEADRVVIGALQLMFLWALVLAGRQAGLGSFFYLGLLVAAGMLVYQQTLIRKRAPEGCFRAFLNNHWVGFSVFLGIVLAV